MKKLLTILLLIPVLTSSQGIIQGKEFRFVPKTRPTFLSYPGDSSILMVQRSTGKVFRTHITGGGGGSSAWGAITGTLSAQTDLNNALLARMLYSDSNSLIASQYWVLNRGYITTRDRFAFSGEDATAAADRLFNLNNNKIDLDSGSLHVRRKMTSPRLDDIFSVSAGSNKAFWVTQLNQTYAGELYAGSGSFYAIGGTLGITNAQVNLSGSTLFQAFQKKFEINKSWPGLVDSTGFEIKNDTFGISTLGADYNKTYKIASLKYRSGVDNTLTERFDFRGNGDMNITGTGALKINVGNTAQRPSPASVGMTRINTDSIGAGYSFEYYDGTAWKNNRTSGGGASDGYVSSVTFNTTSNYLTIGQTGAADVSVRIPPNYIRNTVNIDSISKSLPGDSILRLKAIVVAGTDPIIVTPVRNDSINTHTVSVRATFLDSIRNHFVNYEYELEREWILACSDETTALTTGTAKLTFRVPYDVTVTGVRASVNTVSSSGIPTVDINENGTTILSTKLTIDVSEKTSVTAATAAVISDTQLTNDSEITIDIDTAGTGTKGLKVIIYYKRNAP